MNSNSWHFIFDFGGVLLDWNPGYLFRKFFNGDAEATQKFLDEIEFYQWNRFLDVGRPFSEVMELACGKFPQYRELIRAYDTDWEESIAGPIQSNVEILKALKEDGYRLYALSNFSGEKFPIMRQKYDFLDWFDHIILSGDVGLKKPDERIFHLLLEKTGCNAEECVLIDDSLRNIETARGLGFHTIHFQSSSQLRSELTAMGIDLPAI
ncbi:MAG: HAD family hydrolase [Omnitrophica WOR_2 bacterium]